MPIPAKIANAPELLPGLEIYMAAFHDLESERIQGIDLGPIPRSAIVSYARELDMGEEDFEDLYHHVRSLDIFFLKWQAKKANKKGKG